MHHALISRKRNVSRLARLAVLLTAGGAVASSFLVANAEERRRSAQPSEFQATAASPADLERGFWVCDYVGTHQSVDSGMGIACSMITEELKNRNFAGDFDAMLAWWRRNKPAEHERVAAASRANGGMTSGLMPMR